MRNPVLLQGSYADQMDAICAIAAPILFQQGGSIVRIQGNQIDQLNATSLQSHLIDYCTPVVMKKNKEGEEEETPQKKFERDLCQHLIDRTEKSLSELEYIYRCPVFDDAYNVYSQHGYHAEVRAWLDTDSLGTVEPMAVAEAKRIIDDLFVDFPFADQASKTGAILALVTPFIRPAVDLMPLFFITAPTEGSGKTLLAQLIGLIADGRQATLITAPSDDDEWRKRITSTLMASPSVVILDNVEDLDSPSLAAVLTAKIWSDRLLGSSQTVNIPNRAIWFATGNNPTVSAEMARRCVLIRLVPDSERPADRKFRHTDIERYVAEHRRELVCAAMTLVYSWWMAGCATTEVSMGSYQRWATAAVSIATHHGYGDAMTNRQTLRTEANDELRAFVEMWASRSDIRKRATASDLERLCRAEDDGEMLTDVRGSSFHEHIRARKLSVYLSSQADRVYAGWRITYEQDPKHKHRVFSLEAVI